MLTVGRDGQIARALRAAGGDDVIALGRAALDLAHPESFAPTLAAHAPDVVACVGAYTSVDAAELDPDPVMQINAEGPGALAAECERLGVPFIFVSTDYVFDGRKDAPYLEGDAPAPLNVYGLSKAEGERRVAAACSRHVILRTSWVFDAAGRNFVRGVLSRAQKSENVYGVIDQIGAPTYAGHIATGLLSIARDLARGKQSFGVYHMTAAGEVAWADFAEATFAGALDRGGPSAAVDRVTAAVYQTRVASRVRRPANSRLNCDRLAADFGVRLPPWRVGLEACLDEIAAGGWAVG